MVLKEVLGQGSCSVLFFLKWMLSCFVLVFWWVRLSICGMKLELMIFICGVCFLSLMVKFLVFVVMFSIWWGEWVRVLVVVVWCYFWFMFRFSIWLSRLQCGVMEVNIFCMVCFLFCLLLIGGLFLVVMGGRQQFWVFGGGCGVFWVCQGVWLCFCFGFVILFEFENGQCFK